ncbi:aminotransferase class I/II-fold pyridoxal phosphate-dependent enzyme [uncultured Parolsenella sp.]|uniref:pyridoxal phosphate-dependent aminotransferase n=1 Tax=uncultured Parolsenella sp. TaxID=2083008 RepID=UPI0025D78063|nr:aminotransferase class I/II-fold pyridoxal phosphate-dependent enzyme [uncultured Parolsenella sp.]
MQQLSNKTSHFTDSVIRRMTRVSMKYDAINLSQGFPDFDPPAEILDRLAQVAHEGPHQYAITWGAPNFRAALAAKQAPRMGIPVDPETQVVVTCGSTEAMMCSVMTVCNPGDRVVVFSPFYENYGADAILCDAEPTYVELHAPEFTFDEAELEAACARPNTKALILCNPSNPTGHVFTRAELDVIARLADKYDLWVITDEVYEHIVYAPYEHVYFASLPGMAERTLSCSSLSKTYSMTGWRLGYVIAPAEVTDRLRKVHDFLTVGAAAPLMEAAVVGLELPQSYYDNLRELYTHKRNLFCEGLRERGFEFVEPEGAYYVMCDISSCGYDNDEEFAVDFCKKVGVGAVPGSCFFHAPENRFVRFHFAKSDEVLNAALSRLDGWHEKMARA